MTGGPRDKDTVKAAYAKLRAEADAWQKARLDFMLPRLEAGRHPDTDPTFWQGYVETPPPSIPSVMASVGAARPGVVAGQEPADHDVRVPGGGWSKKAR